MSRTRSRVLVSAKAALGLALVAGLAAPGLPAQEPAAEAPGDPPRTQHARELRSLIRDLGADDFATRERARARLLELGPEAAPWLERATRDKDAERAAAAEELLAALRWWIPPELRPTVGELLDDFPGQAKPRRLDALARLGQLGPQARAATRFVLSALRFDPDPEVRLLAGEVYLRVAPEGRGEHDRQALLALDAPGEPGPQVRFLRARLFVRLGRPREAADEAGQAYLAVPGEPTLGKFLLELLLAQGDLDAALPVARDLAERNPEDAHARVLLGEALARAGQVEEGLAQLAAALAVPGAEQDEALLVRLGRAYLACGRPDEADRVFKAALGRFPYSRPLNVARADVLRAQGDEARALLIYLSEVRYAEPGTAALAELRTRLDEVLRARGAPADALDDVFFEDARRGRPLAEVQRAVAAWCGKRRLHDEAVRALALARALEPGPASALLLGDALGEAGRWEQAEAAYAEAARLAPDDRRPKARLADLAGRRAAAAGAEAQAEQPAGFAAWERRLGPDELARGVEAAAAEVLPPPLVTGERVVVPAAGTVDLLGLDAKDGALVWRFQPEPPADAAAGADAAQVGLELVALVELPSAAVAARAPRRARDPRPVVAALYDVYWRPSHRSWRKARFVGLHAWVVDPLDGALLLTRQLDAEAQVVPPEPAALRARVLCFASPRPQRVLLEQLDLVLGRPRWRTAVPAAGLRRPLPLEGGAVVAWRTGVARLDDAGAEVWRHDRAAAPAGPEGEASPGPEGEAGVGVSAVTTDPAQVGEGVVFGTSDGWLVRLDVATGAATPWARVGEDRLTGELAALGSHLFVAVRGGALSAWRLPAPGAGAPAELGAGAPPAPRAPALAWRQAGLRAAERRLRVAGGLLFSVSGVEDAFPDEVPLLQALEPETGRVLLQRPLERPATFGAGHGLVVVSSGGRASRAGLRVVGLRPAERLDADVARRAALREATLDALAERQAEVAAVLARRWAAVSGGLEALDHEGLAVLVRAFAASRRRDAALDLVHAGEERGGEALLEFWEGVRREAGLLEAPPPGAPGDGAPPQAPGDPGAQPPAPGPDAAPPGGGAPPPPGG